MTTRSKQRRSVSMSYRSFLLLIATGAIFALSLNLAAAARQQKQILPESTPQAPGEVKVRFFCSDTQLRTPVAEVTWAPKVSAETAPTTQRLDVTVYKDGFQTGRYVTLTPLRKEQKTVVAPGAQAKMPIARSLNLQISDVTSPDKNGKMMSVKIERLEPGLNYFFRVLSDTDVGWAPSPVVRGQVVVCPADMVEPPPQR